MNELVPRVAALEGSVRDLKTQEFATVNDPRYSQLLFINTLANMPGMQWVSNATMRNLASGGSCPNATPAWLVTSEFLNIPTSRPFIELDGGQWLSFSTSSNVGELSWSTVAVPEYFNDVGICAGAWVWIDSHETDGHSPLSAWNAQSSLAAWTLRVNGSGEPAMYVTDTGVYDSSQTAQLSTAIPLDTWVFIVGRFRPNWFVEINLYMDGVRYYEKNTTSINTDITRTNLGFLGNMREADGTNLAWNGRIGTTFWSRSVYSDDQTMWLYEISRPMYGV